MVIMKFGGTSVATKEGILTIRNIAEKMLQKKPVVVVSAVSGVTNLLLSLPDLSENETKNTLKKLGEMHKALARSVVKDQKTLIKLEKCLDEDLKKLELFIERKNFSKADLDRLVSFGEILSSCIIAAVLNSSGLKAEQVVSDKLVITDDNFMSADFLPGPTRKETRKVILPLIKKGIVPVVTGFIGSSRLGKITTLGRGGSDYSASILAFALDAEEVQIWTDVDGIFSSDPKVVRNAKFIEQISFREASELAYFGAKVLHPRTIRPAVQKNIPVRVLNTFKPEGKGTLITEKPSGKKGLRAFAFNKSTTLINLYATEMLFTKGYLAEIFSIFASYDVSVNLVSVSEVSVSVTLDNNPKIKDLLNELKKYATLSVNQKVGTISLIGEDLLASSHVLDDISSLFHQEKMHIYMISFGASNINISLVVDSVNLEKAVKLLHDQLL